FFFFFFSSRRRHTRSKRDWSSDVCSSDLSLSLVATSMDQPMEVVNPWKARMECPQCRHANPPETKFCGECGTRLQSFCSACQAVNPPTNKFCNECGQRLTGAAPASAAATAAALVTPSGRFASPEAYTPKHLAEKILTSKSEIG